MSSGTVPLYHYWSPRYWPTWLGVGLLRLVVALPHPKRMAVGRWLGRRVQWLIGARRAVADRNLKICFPELSAAERQTLAREHFESLGMGVIELGMAWWTPQQELEDLTIIEGMEHFQAGFAAGRGVLILSGHFAATEISGRVLEPLLPPLAAMYRPSKNALNDQIMRRCRGRSTPDLITKSSIKTLLRVLKNNRGVWYAADQAYSRKGTVLVPFFGEPATTNTSVSQIARISKAAVVPFHSQRRAHDAGYRLVCQPALEEFPSGDDAADANRLNRILEAQIRTAPAQYYWVHRRFKDRPEGYTDPYT